MTAGKDGRCDRVRAMLADLKMPGALEAVDGILARANGSAVTATGAIEELLEAQKLGDPNKGAVCHPFCCHRIC